MKFTDGALCIDTYAELMSILPLLKSWSFIKYSLNVLIQLVNIAYGSPFSSFACQFMDSVLDELHGRHVRKIWCSFFSLFINQVKVPFAG